jgi:hypothetical protein
MKKVKRTSQGLRDILFEELEELRHGDGDPSKAMAVANLAKQIINTAKIEMDYINTTMKLQESGTPMKLGAMELGSNASSAEPPSTVLS